MARLDKGAAVVDEKKAARNAVRKKLYESDPDYREARIEQSRESYRRRENARPLRDGLTRLNRITEFGEHRTVWRVDEAGNGIGSMFAAHCLTIKELATILGPYEMQVLYRWKAKGLIPAPIYRARLLVETEGKGGSYESEQGVYLVPEVAAMIRVIGEHQTRLLYYTVKNTDTIEKVFAEVEAARAAL